VASVLFRTREATTMRVALALDEVAWADDAERILTRRGAICQRVALEDALDAPAGVIGLALREAPAPALVAHLAPRCARVARAGRPLVLLASFPRLAGARGDLQAACLATLRSHGAILCPDPDSWLEALILVAGFGLPPGPRVAVVAPPGSWISASAQFLANEAAAVGVRVAALSPDMGKLGPTDAVLVDRDELARVPPERTTSALLLPMVGRAELVGDDDRRVLVGLRAALAAAGAAGRLRERLAAGLGPAEVSEIDSLGVDQERFTRQLAKLGTRAGDHETKVLLSAWKIPITRQAVATTASAATGVAKRAGYPVELKPWGPDAPSEPDGCPVERDLATAADVRRAFAALSRAMGQPDGAPVIVRETPPAGRELRARVTTMAELGRVVLVDVAGTPGPIAAPAPLRVVEAEELARHVEASRVGDAQPDRHALADLLRRASFLGCHERIESLDLCRIIAAAREGGVVVADARATLRGS
jgi:ATP-grasp domain